MTRKFWQSPWRYKEGWTIVAAIFVVSELLEYFTGGLNVRLRWPINISIAAGLITIITVLHIFFRKTSLVKFLGSIPAAITSIVYFTFLVLLLGLIPQDPERVPGWMAKLGFTDLITSWYFVLAQIYLLISLGLVTARRLVPFKGKNIGFFLNHAGLWITLVAGLLGTGDLFKLTMETAEGKGFVNMATDSKGEKFHLGIALQLLDFEIDEYPSKLYLFDTNKGTLDDSDKSPAPEVSKGATFNMKNYKVEVLEYYDFAVPENDTLYIRDSIEGSSHAALLKVTNTTNNEVKQGWVSTKTFVMPSQYLILNDKDGIYMAEPEPLKYRSKLVYITKDNLTDTVVVEVNKPVQAGNWKLYQVGYNSELGRWSDESVIELVTDPWLPAVYLGLFMLLAGGAYIFWVGRQK